MDKIFHKKSCHINFLSMFASLMSPLNLDALPISFEDFFHVRAFGDKKVYPKSRLTIKTPNTRADFRRTTSC